MGGPSLWDKVEHRTRVPVHLMNAQFDVVSGALITIDYPHHEVHDGHGFECTIYDASVPNSATLILAVAFPAGIAAHFVYDAAAGGDATVEFLEGATLAAGTPAAIVNLNRNHPDCSFGALVDPTLGGAPVTLQSTFLPGGSGPQAQGAIAIPRAGLEWITRPDTTYAIRLTNISGQAQPGNIRIAFYTPD